MAMAFYRNRKSDTLVIVEDQFSAIRVSKYVNAVALLGTNLSQDRATTIRQAGFSRHVLALDKDAWGPAVGYALKYRSLLKLELLRLEKDLKDMAPKEIEEVLDGASITRCQST